MASVFLEIVFNAPDLQAIGIESRDEIEEPLEEALADSGLGEVTGGGGGSGVAIIDIEVDDEERLEEALSVIRTLLRSRGVPRSTIIKRSRPTEVSYEVYE